MPRLRRKSPSSSNSSNVDPRKSHKKRTKKKSRKSRPRSKSRSRYPRHPRHHHHDDRHHHNHKSRKSHKKKLISHRRREKPQNPVVSFNIIQPSAEPIIQPSAESIIQPIIKPVLRPTAESIIQPIAESIIQPITEPIIESSDFTGLEGSGRQVFTFSKLDPKIGPIVEMRHNGELLAITVKSMENSKSSKISVTYQGKQLSKLNSLKAGINFLPLIHTGIIPLHQNHELIVNFYSSSNTNWISQVSVSVN